MVAFTYSLHSAYLSPQQPISSVPRVGSEQSTSLAKSVALVNEIKPLFDVSALTFDSRGGLLEGTTRSLGKV